MAELVHHWPMDEGTGEVLSDAIAESDLTIATVGDYPEWLGAEPGLRFSGGSTGTGHCYDAVAEEECNRKIGPYAISAWFNLEGATTNYGGRLIVGTSAYEPWQTGFGNQFKIQDFLCIGTNGKPCFIGAHNPSAAAYLIGVTGTTNLVGSDGWHHIVGHLDATADIQYPRYRLWLDGELEADEIKGPPKRADIQYRGFLVGAGSPFDIWIDYYGGNGPYLNANSNGTFPGSIRDARVYCGDLTDEDVLELYRNTIMIPGYELPDVTGIEGWVGLVEWPGVYCLDPSNTKPSNVWSESR